jgi:hypothetical protein
MKVISVNESMPEVNDTAITYLLFAKQKKYHADDNQGKQWFVGYLRDNRDGTDSWVLETNDDDPANWLVSHWMELPDDPGDLLAKPPAAEP